MRTQEERDEAIHYKTNSLCWQCARACGGAHCPWADRLEPVSGWVIAPEDSSSAVTKGSIVLYCPMFFKGRNRSVMSPDDIDSTATNCQPDVSKQVCRPLVIHDRSKTRTYKGATVTKLHQCPKCKHLHEFLTPRCSNCGIKFLTDRSYHYFAAMPSILLRQRFLKDYKSDFPGSDIDDI